MTMTLPNADLSNKGWLLPRLFSRAVSVTMVPPAFVLPAATRLAFEVCGTQLDKGSKTTPLWQHILDVVDVLVVEYKHRLSREDMEDLRAKALLHEVLETRDEAGNFLCTTARLKQEGFSPEFIKGIELLAKRPGEQYLQYIHRLALSGDINAMRVKIADIQINIPNREHGHKPPSQQLKDKKAFLYPGSREYLRNVLDGRIDPAVTTPAMFIANAGLATADQLKPYWEKPLDTVPKISPVKGWRSVLALF